MPIETWNEKLTGGKEKIFDKNQYLRQKFQQVVFQALSNKGEGDQNFENEKKFVMPNEIDISLNLSGMDMSEFPQELLDKMQNVQYLYLEGSKLTELPESFFEKLPSLKWLDLRNNGLSSLPTQGLKNHPCLEIILLQGNRIRILPVELAKIPTLKGLQTTGNPLTNVPYDCIAEGFSSVVNHLKKLCMQNDMLVSGSQTIVVKSSSTGGENSNELNEKRGVSTTAEINSWDLEKLSQWRHFMKKKSKINDFLGTHVSYKNQKHISQKTKVVVKVRPSPKAPFKQPPFKCGICPKSKHKSSAFYRSKMRKTRLGYKRNPITPAMIEEKAQKEALSAQLRETLEKQAKRIQRLRDREVLKVWRDHAQTARNQIKLLDNYQRYPSRDFADKTPFDVDPEFLSMINRVDLYRSSNEYDNRSKGVKKPKIRFTAFDLERQMNEIISKLQQLDTNETDENESFENKEIQMCHKISKIKDIQKTLKRLQSLNSSMCGITPLGKPKITGK